MVAPSAQCPLDVPYHQIRAKGNWHMLQLGGKLPSENAASKFCYCFPLLWCFQQQASCPTFVPSTSSITRAASFDSVSPLICMTRSSQMPGIRSFCIFARMIRTPSEPSACPCCFTKVSPSSRLLIISATESFRSPPRASWPAYMI